MKHLLRLLLFVSTFSIPVTAQDIAETNTDILLEEAQVAYQDGNFEQSLKLTHRGLELAPEYHDIRILQIRNQWALGQLQAADKNLEFLLENAPYYIDLKPLLHQRISRFERKADALAFIARIAQLYPEDMRLQTQRARLLYETDQLEQAREIANDLLGKPDISGPQRYVLQTILRGTATDEIGLSYQYTHFSGEYSRNSWNSLIAEYQHNFNRTAVIGRVIHTDRSYAEGNMYELEMYPVLNDQWYGFANIGFSNSEIFPDFRASASVYHNFAAAFEAEVGGRLLHLPHADYFNAVLGISLYEGSFLFNIRSFLGPKRLEKLVQNYQANVRYYFNNPDNYLFLRAGTGISPDEQNRAQEAQLQPELKAFYTNLGIRHIFINRHIIQVETGLLNEEIGSGDYGTQLTFAVGYRYRF